MAVSRIKADQRWFKQAAAAVEPTAPKAARELLRAVDRPGRMAELSSEEVEALALAMPDDDLVATALTDVRESLVRERNRTAALRARLDLRRGAPTT